MTSTFKRVGFPLTVTVVGNAILAAIWWVNGAEREDLWLYALAAFFVLYAAYELFTGLRKHYKD
jgi:hypothetical protein